MGRNLARVGDLKLTEDHFIDFVYGLPIGIRHYLNTESSRRDLLAMIVDEEVLLQRSSENGFARTKNF